MRKKHHTKKRVLALLLWLVLISPSVFNFIHQFESHDHFDCSENKSHIHVLSSECQSCDFNLLTLNYELYEYSELINPSFSKTKEYGTNFVKFKFYNYNYKQLRAPPLLS
mgnify:FL=1